MLFCFLSGFRMFSAHGQQWTDTLSQELDRLATAAGLPGYTAVLLNNKGVCFRHSAGFADIGQQVAFTTHTVENVGSVSKTLIAVAVMMGIERGWFTLDTDIDSLLPFSARNPWYPTDTIRVRHLATHTSGIIDNDSIYTRSYRFGQLDGADSGAMKMLRERGYVGGLCDTTLDSFLGNYLQPSGRLYTDKNFAHAHPGQRASYSNIASALAAWLVELRSGLSYENFTARYIFRPLRMNQSGWQPDHRPGQAARPYLGRMPLPYYRLTTYPDGGLRSSAEDLARYTLAMMQGLQGRSRLLQPSSFAAMFKPAFTERDVPQGMSLQTRNKGVFWNIYNDGYIGHDGDDPGVSTNLLFNRQTGIIFMTNVYLEDRSAFLRLLKQYGERAARR